MTELVRVRANAKLNLVLRVLGARDDGFHELQSVFQSVDLADDLTFRNARDLVVSGALAPGVTGTLPMPEENLISVAATALARREDVTRGAQIEVLKRIPMAAGLGGGSVDAAAALLALNELWDLGLRRRELEVLAAEVGSDVPFFLTGGTAFVTGRGDSVVPLTPATSLWFVIGISAAPLRTEEVYAAWDGLRDSASGPPAPIDRDELDARLQRGPREVAALVANDLEAAAMELRPELRTHKEALLDAGALAAAVAGSGPSLFALVADRDAAQALAGRVAGIFDRVEVAGTRASGVELV